MFEFLKRDQPVEQLSSTKTVRIYSGTGYGCGTLFVAPGTHHPEVEGWTKIVDGNVVPVQISVKFKEGAADVPENLADYMVRHQMASRTPVRIPIPSQDRAMAEIGGLPQYQAPIAVGRAVDAYSDLVKRGLA